MDVTKCQFWLAIVLLAVFQPALAHQHTVCSDTPDGKPVDCREDSTSTSDITINLVSQEIMTSLTNIFSAVYADQKGTGNIDIDVTDSTLSTTVDDDHGIWAHNKVGSTGNIDINVSGGSITITGAFAHAINAHGRGGNVTVTASNPDIVTTDGSGINITRDGSGNGNATVVVTGGSITVDGASDIAVSAFINAGITGDVTIDVRDTTLTSKGTFAHGVHGLMGSPNATPTTGDIDIKISGATIVTESTENHPGFPQPIPSRTRSVPWGGTTEPAISSCPFRAPARSRRMAVPAIGLYGNHWGDGNILIDASEATITTAGASAHGIVAYQDKAGNDGSMTISAGPITATGLGAMGVLTGFADEYGPRFGGLDTDGFRKHTVNVNGPITSNSAGVYIYNGGRVIIGPQGSIDSDSNIAILATGTIPQDDSDPNNIIPAIPPKLWVNLKLAGRRIADVIHDNWIVNDGGETTIAVNDVVLHEGATGVTTNVAPNGIWDVTMTGPGVKLTDYTVDFSTTALTAGVFADRDFSASDFTEEQARCPAGQIGSPGSCRNPPPPSSSSARGMP